VSDITAHAIDKEVKAVIDRNYSRAETVLKENVELLHAMAAALLKYETIDEAQIKDIMEGREPRQPKDWDDDTGRKKPESKGEAADKPKDGKIGGPAGQH
jgi:cell division protease FtsH